MLLIVLVLVAHTTGRRVRGSSELPTLYVRRPVCEYIRTLSILRTLSLLVLTHDVIYSSTGSPSVQNGLQNTTWDHGKYDAVGIETPRHRYRIIGMHMYLPTYVRTYLPIIRPAAEPTRQRGKFEACIPRHEISRRFNPSHLVFSAGIYS